MFDNKANLRNLIDATGLVILLKLDSKRLFFSPCDLEIWWTLKNYRAPLLHYIKICASSQTPRWIQTGVTVRKRSIWVKIGDFFVLCDLEIWLMTLKNNRAPLLCYIKLYASFQSHWWIQTGVTVRKHSIRVKIGYLLSCVTLKFDRWPSKTIGHIFYATSSFVHHFIAIGELKLNLQPRNSQFGSKSVSFVRCDLEIWRSTLKNNRALFYVTSSFVHHFIAIGEFKLELVRKRSILVKTTIFWAVWSWKMTGDLKKYGTSPKQHQPLYASFDHHMWIQTGVTVRKQLSWVMTSVTLTFDLDLLHGHHFCHWY